ncbi:MAG: DUF1810 domain-containing protein [Sphingomicrobium sp.]
MSAPDPYNLQRLIDAQQSVFATALSELVAGSKRSHWMWFVFPQLAGLGRSSTAIFYGIGGLDEARAYFEHPLLGARLRQSLEALRAWTDKRSAEQTFGGVDAVKLRSCLTLFDCVSPHDLFATGLAAFFAGEADERTLALLAPTR